MSRLMKLPDWLVARLARAIPALHRRIWQVTGGRLGWRLGEVEFCLLTTTGRHTAKEHVTPLVLVRVGSRLVLVASNGGSDRHPDWFLNIVKHHRVALETKGERSTKYARVAAEAERMELWSQARRVYSGYDAYQSKTDRIIPIVVLEDGPGLPNGGLAT